MEDPYFNVSLEIKTSGTKTNVIIEADDSIQAYNKITELSNHTIVNVVPIKITQLDETEEQNINNNKFTKQ